VDCRLNCFACGILPTFADLRRDHPGNVWKCPDVKSPRGKTTGQSPVTTHQPKTLTNELPVMGN
jgi:hypothetical protein